jgi:protein-S-isoprenylcysteine O-methyltransferase Ste14
LIPVAIAAVLLLWILASALPHTPARVEIGLTPQVLLTHGPFRLSRNPLYIAELGLWLGWAFFFGSLGVAIGFVVLLSIVGLVFVPREERTLEAAFGQNYVDYKATVPRWLGRIRK